MKNSTKPLYNCSMAVLYSILKFAWTLYLKYVDAFAAVNSSYTKELGENALKAVAAAVQMPDKDQRNSNTKESGTDLGKAAKKAVGLWKQARVSILKSVTPDNAEAALQKAGSAHYKAATKYEYAEVVILLSDGLSYITTNEADLLKAGMPENFIENYTAAQDTFNELYVAYGEAKGDASEGTYDKVTVNNTLYTNYKAMSTDALTVFEDKVNIRNQFSFAAIKRLVTVDVPGIHFLIQDADTKKPLDTATISIAGKKKPYAVNKRGVADIRLAKDAYNVTVTVPGYNSFNASLTVGGNSMQRQIITLKKIAEATA